MFNLGRNQFRLRLTVSCICILSYFYSLWFITFSAALSIGHSATYYINFIFFFIGWWFPFISQCFGICRSVDLHLDWTIRIHDSMPQRTECHRCTLMVLFLIKRRRTSFIIIILDSISWMEFGWDISFYCYFEFVQRKVLQIN